VAQTSGFLLGFDYARNVDNVALLIKTATDASGSLYILSLCTVGGTLSCLTKVSSDGQTLWQDALGLEASGIAVDGDGETYVATAGPFGSPVTPQFLEKVSPDGRDVLWQTALPTTPAPMDVAIDSAGNAYVARSSGSVIQMKNSLAACLPGGAPYISVFASDGSLLQSTYLPGAGSGGAWGLTVASNSAVYAIAGPVIRLSPNNSAQTVPLVCMGSSATYNASYSPQCLDPLFCTAVPLTVSYGGPAPYGLAGLTQIQVQVPPAGPCSRDSNIGLMWVNVNGNSNGFCVW